MASFLPVARAAMRMAPRAAPAFRTFSTSRMGKLRKQLDTIDH